MYTLDNHIWHAMSIVKIQIYYYYSTLQYRMYSSMSKGLKLRVCSSIEVYWQPVPVAWVQLN